MEQIQKEKQPQKLNYPDWQGLQAVMYMWADGNLKDLITIETTLSHRQGHWVILLKEKWPGIGDPLTDGQMLKERINWCQEKLKDWPSCKRMAYDQFWFKNKEQAEKFITLYTLTWR